MTVGFFDSGIGGVSVLEKATVVLPDTDFLFYADLAHVPYGKKTQEEIAQYVDDAVAFLHAHGADIIVLASDECGCQKAARKVRFSDPRHGASG